MNITQASVLSAFTSTAIVLAITIIRQKRFDRTDIGVLCSTFLAGFNIPASIFLSCYVFYPDPPEVLNQTRLMGYEKFFAFSGISLFFVSLTTIWSFIQLAYKQSSAE